MTATAAIIAHQLTRCFNDLTAVDRLDLSIAPGEIFGLVGPDGAGKTTTLRMLAAVLDPSDGQAQVAGCDIATDAEGIKTGTAYMSQHFGLYADLTVKENIDFYADLYGLGRKDRGQRMDELLGFSGMLPFKKRRAGQLSGGMKQKLQLVCALIHTPRVLLLDEPTNGVDPVSRRDFWRVLYRLLAQGVAILVTTAYLDEAERCHRVGLLHRGRLLTAGTPNDIKGQMKGQILAIRTPQPHLTLRTLGSRLGKTHSFGSSVHLVCDHPKDTAVKALHALRAASIPVKAIKSVAPTLEDVFITLLQTDRQDAADETPDHQIAAKKRISDQQAVTVTGLTRRFGSFTAVDKISFSVQPGEVFGFLGPNGAGKSTTIRMLCGLLKPSAGSGTVAGYDINSQAEQIKQHIGYMSQKFSLYDDLTPEENINFYGGIYGLNGRRLESRKDWAVAMAGLEDRRHSPTKILSGGWKQRLALACAILHEPPIIFLDEPTSGVDPLSRRRFWDLIYTMADQGTTVFVTTHYMEEAEYCGRLALIYQGGLIAMGTPSDLKANMLSDTVLDVRCEQPQEALETVLAINIVRDAALFGDGLHVRVSEPRQASAAILKALQNQSISTGKITAVSPSMEDVFVALIEAQDRDGGGP